MEISFNENQNEKGSNVFGNSNDKEHLPSSFNLDQLRIDTEENLRSKNLDFQPKGNYQCNT